MSEITVRELGVGDWIAHEGKQLEVMRIRKITQRKRLIACAPKGQRHEEPIIELPMDHTLDLICRYPLSPWEITKAKRIRLDIEEEA